MKIRLKDVAARAGVAVNTASTILNRRPNSWASKDTEARVFKAAEDLGYRPNRAAASLRSGKFHTIGLLIPDLHNPFYTAFADLLDLAAEARGYDLILESWRTDLQREKHCLEDLASRQIDGMASFLSDNAVHQDWLAERALLKRPFVALSGAGGAPLPVDSVLVDFASGLGEAIEALFAGGHRRFGFLCALAPGQDDGERVRHFRELLGGHGISEEGFAFVRCDHAIESAHAAAAQLFERDAASRPTALIALNDLSAIGAMRAAADKGLRVPEDLSVVGVDSIPLGRFLPVSLSTIAQPLELMAGATARFLIERMENREKPGTEQAIFPTHFILRESVGKAPR